MTVEELAYDDDFQSLLEMIAEQRNLYSFDDYRQDVFLEILDCGYTSETEYIRAARRVSHRHARDQVDEDIDRYCMLDDEGQQESHDEAMGRMVYTGEAFKIS